MISEIEIETEKSPKIKKKTQEAVMWFLLCFNSDTDRKTVKERSRSRVCINSKEHENVISFRMHIITFLGIKEQARSLGVPDFELKIFRLQITMEKAKII